MENNKRLKFWTALIVISLAGMALRWMGMPFEGIDYQICLLPWYQDLKDIGNIHALAEFEGGYNMPYIVLLYFLTWIPVEPLISIKMLSIVFDYLLAILILFMVREVADAKRWELYGAIAYGLVLLNPVVIINSGYLAQCESIWVFLALAAFWMVWKGHPAWGMLFFGFSFGIKPQGIFILPILLIYYFKEKKFSILNLLWALVGIQLACVPAFIGGCSFDIFWSYSFTMTDIYPFVYYYYPNVWTYLQEAPYYVYGKVAIASTFVVLLLFAVLLVRSRKKATFQEMLSYVIWTTMTCAMILPCMHERYNYLAEVLLAVCAIWKKKYRLPALVLILVSAQCCGQSYMAWPWVSHYALAAVNIAIYLYLTKDTMVDLYCAGLPEMEERNAEN